MTWFFCLPVPRPVSIPDYEMSAGRDNIWRRTSRRRHDGGGPGTVALAAVGLILSLAAPSFAEGPTAREPDEVPLLAALPLTQLLRIENGLPAPLSARDVDAYRRAFAASDRHDWPAADRALAAVDDRRLVGTVLADRLLAPG